MSTPTTSKPSLLQSVQLRAGQVAKFSGVTTLISGAAAGIANRLGAPFLQALAKGQYALITGHKAPVILAGKVGLRVLTHMNKLALVALAIFAISGGIYLLAKNIQNRLSHALDPSSYAAAGHSPKKA